MTTPIATLEQFFQKQPHNEEQDFVLDLFKTLPPSCQQRFAETKLSRMRDIHQLAEQLVQLQEDIQKTAQAFSTLYPGDSWQAAQRKFALDDETVQILLPFFSRYATATETIQLFEAAAKIPNDMRSLLIGNITHLFKSSPTPVLVAFGRCPKEKLLDLAASAAPLVVDCPDSYEVAKVLKGFLAADPSKWEKLSKISKPFIEICRGDGDQLCRLLKCQIPTIIPKHFLAKCHNGYQLALLFEMLPVAADEKAFLVQCENIYQMQRVLRQLDVTSKAVQEDASIFLNRCENGDQICRLLKVLEGLSPEQREFQVNRAERIIDTTTYFHQMIAKLCRRSSYV